MLILESLERKGKRRRKERRTKTMGRQEEARSKNLDGMLRGYDLILRSKR